MKQYNITAQLYNKFDKYKQTILMNEVITASSKEDANKSFHEMFSLDHKILKIYSTEEIVKESV